MRAELRCIDNKSRVKVLIYLTFDVVLDDCQVPIYILEKAPVRSTVVDRYGLLMKIRVSSG